MIKIQDSFVKQFGDVIKEASSLKESPPKIISVTPRLDLILSGGVPEGSFIVLTGGPGVGKSSLALQIAANAQKIDSEWGKRQVHYFDIEARLKERDVYGNQALNKDKGRFQIYSSIIGNIVTGDQFLDMGEQLINSEPGHVFIFDSLSSLCTEARHKADIKERFRDDVPFLLSSFCKRTAQVLAVNKSIVIGITHKISDQGPGPKMWGEASGIKIQYHADVKLKGTHFSAWNVGESQVGQEVFWQCEKSALGPPNMKTSSFLRYNYGIDILHEVALCAVDFGIIKKSGAWFELPDKKKIQGIEKVRNYLEENEKIYQGLLKEMASLC